MNTETPKQFLIVSRKPLLYYTLNCFCNFSKEIEIILVLPDPYIDFWKSLCKKYDIGIEHKLTVGGDSRYQSVKNGLKLISDSCLVAIHDGVRPLVSENTLKRVFEKAEKEGNAIPILQLNESIRKLDGKESKPVNRDKYRLVQTPQCFHSELIKKAYQQKYNDTFTDDATVVEALGVKINLVKGNSENIKITSPGDLKVAKALIK